MNHPLVINARYVERILIPESAFPGGSFESMPIRTSDGVCCTAHFLCTWDNSDHRFDDELDGLCFRQWDCSFDLIRKMWDGRLVDRGNIWHYVELKRTDQ